VGDEEQKDERTGYDRIGRVAVWGGVVVGGYFFADRVVEPRAENHPVSVAAAIVIAGLVAFGVYRWQEWQSERESREWSKARIDELDRWKEDHLDDPDGDGYEFPARPNFKPNHVWVPPLVTLGVIIGWVGLQGGWAVRTHEIADYCSYGAVSDAQRDECENHVSSAYIDSLDTNAARFATGQLKECLEDAGPYCDGARTGKEYDEQRNPNE
jgi:hypothetical protein